MQVLICVLISAAVLFCIAAAVGAFRPKSDGARDIPDHAVTTEQLTVSSEKPSVSTEELTVSAEKYAASQAEISLPVEQTASTGTAAKVYSSPMERYFYDDDFWKGCPPRDVQLLTPNPYSRPGDPLEEVRDIVIHYVDEPGSTAQQNRDYFESLQDGSRSASSHFIISLDGTIVQCIPLGEVAYASNHRNNDSISIENCHPDESGKFTDETYESCVSLAAWLLYAFDLTPDHVIRHYDVTGKDCPLYYVEHPDAWEQMKADIAEKYAAYKE